MGLKDGTKSNGFTGQYKEQRGLQDSTKNNGFKRQYKEQWA